MNPSKVSPFFFFFLLMGADASAVPISITQTGSLSFGKFAAGAGGTVTISPTGSRSATGGVGLLSSFGGTAARFLITGDPGVSFVLSFPSLEEASIRSGASSMSLIAFSCSPSTAGSLDASGTQAISVGATLKVDPAKLPSDYNGTYSIIVDYQ